MEIDNSQSSTESHAETFHREMAVLKKATPERLALLEQKPDHIIHLIRGCFMRQDRTPDYEFPTHEEMITVVRAKGKLLLELVRIDYRKEFDVPHDVKLEAAKSDGMATASILKNCGGDIPPDIVEAALAQNPHAEKLLLPTDQWTIEW